MREFSLEAFFSQWQPLVRHQLTASESETTALADLLRMADDEDRDRWQHLKFGYTDPRGAAFLRRAIAGYYDAVREDDVLCFTGAQEAIYAVMHALLQPTDHVIVVTPTYQSAETIPLSLCATSGVALDPAQGWTLDIDKLAAAIRPNTKLIAINFPNNPTGKILEADRYRALVALCRRQGIWLFNDEVYRLIERDPALRLPPVVDVYERGISLGSLSKSFGLPGLRLGWVCCRDPAQTKAFRHMKTYLSICSDASSEVLSTIALKAEAEILPRNRLIAQQNLSLLHRLFADHAELFDWSEPQGGVIGFPRYLGAEGVDAWCHRLITEQGLLLMPSRIFRSELSAIPEQHFRVGFGRCDFALGVAALATALKGDGVSVKRARQH